MTSLAVSSIQFFMEFGEYGDSSDHWMTLREEQEIYWTAG